MNLHFLLLIIVFLPINCFSAIQECEIADDLGLIRDKNSKIDVEKKFGDYSIEVCTSNGRIVMSRISNIKVEGEVAYLTSQGLCSGDRNSSKIGSDFLVNWKLDEQIKMFCSEKKWYTRMCLKTVRENCSYERISSFIPTYNISAYQFQQYYLRTLEVFMDSNSDSILNNVKLDRVSLKNLSQIIKLGISEVDVLQIEFHDYSNYVNPGKVESTILVAGNHYFSFIFKPFNNYLVLEKIHSITVD